MCHLCMAAVLFWIAPLPHFGDAMVHPDTATLSEPACEAPAAPAAPRISVTDAPAVPGEPSKTTSRLFHPRIVSLEHDDLLPRHRRLMPPDPSPALPPGQIEATSRSKLAPPDDTQGQAKAGDAVGEHARLPRATNTESPKVPEAKFVEEQMLSIPWPKPSVDTDERSRSWRGAYPPSLPQTQLVIVGPVPLSKFFQSTSFYCSATHAEDWTDPESVGRLLYALEPLEVYIIDRKVQTGSGEWVFESGPEGYPKILLANPFTHQPNVSGIHLDLASQSAGCETESDRHVRIRVTMWRQGETRGQAPILMYSGLDALRQTCELTDYFSDVITYNVDGKILTIPTGKWRDSEPIFPTDVKERSHDSDAPVRLSGSGPHGPERALDVSIFDRN